MQKYCERKKNEFFLGQLAFVKGYRNGFCFLSVLGKYVFKYFNMVFFHYLKDQLKLFLMPKTSISWKSIWIYLKSQMEFWNLKIEFKSEKVLSLLKIHFKYGLSMCMYSSLSCDKV